MEKRFKSVTIQTKLGINHTLNILGTSLDTVFFKMLSLSLSLSTFFMSQDFLPDLSFLPSTTSLSVSLPPSSPSLSLFLIQKQFWSPLFLSLSMQAVIPLSGHITQKPEFCQRGMLRMWPLCWLLSDVHAQVGHISSLILTNIYPIKPCISPITFLNTVRQCSPGDTG